MFQLTWLCICMCKYLVTWHHLTVVVHAGARGGTGGEAGRPPIAKPSTDKPTRAKPLLKSGVHEQQQAKQGTASVSKSSGGRLKAAPAPRPLPTAAAPGAGRAPRATPAARAPRPTPRKLNIMHHQPIPPPLPSASPFNGQKSVTRLARCRT